MATIVINRISRETEKAMLINAMVTYNHDKYFEKEIWMPKSAVKVVGPRSIEIADWLVNKISFANAFHGYQMHFDYIYNN